MAKTRKNKKGRVPPPGPSQCHPRVGTSRPAQGCLPSSIIQRSSKKLGLPASTTRKQLETKLGVVAGEELSFVNALPLSDDEKKYLIKTYLRPPMPSSWKNDPDMWLDSTNIEMVMKQYEEAYSSFEFMGPFPIDFAAPDPYAKDDASNPKCLIREMCGLKVLESKKKGITMIGIIYNLDPHFKNGSHWVANFIDLERHRCYYFDSYGYEPPSQVQKFMKWLTVQDPKMKLAYNARRFQLQGSECGMYSMYFIIRMLMGDDFRRFCRLQPRDSVMLDNRDWLFST